MTQIKAIRIDSAESRFHEVTFEESDTNSICKLVGCRLFDVVRIPQRNVIFVDDEGLLTVNGTSSFFKLEGYDAILVGNGLVVGTGDEGESVEPTTTIEWLEDNISFGKIKEIDGKLYPILN